MMVKKSIILSVLVLLSVFFTNSTIAYAALLGDANNDNTVNSLDYDVWRTFYNNSVTGGSNQADFNNDGKTDGSDYVIWLMHMGSMISTTPTSTVSTTIPSIPTSDTSLNTQTNIFMRHPYQHGSQPALVYEKFDITYWIDNWDLSVNGKSLRVLVQKVNTKTIQYDNLGTPWNTYKSSGASTYPITVCDTPTNTVMDTKIFSKGPVPVSGLVERGFYKITLELLNVDGSSSGKSTSACVEVNREFLSALVHVNKTPGTTGGGESPAYFNSMKQQIAQSMTQLGNIPPCPNHNATKWHAIYDSTRKCHYDHEHKDDPNRSYYDTPSNVGRDGKNRGVGDILSVFGPAWAWLPEKHKAQLPLAYTISYPWQTWSGLDIGAAPPIGKMENDIKHNGYLWLTRTPDDFGAGAPTCEPLYGTPNCITHFREQIHALAGMPDAITHTHSFWLEARICVGGSGGKDNSKCGIYRGGGHIGFGIFGTTRFSITEPGQQELLPFMYTDGPSEISDLDGNGKIDEWDKYYLRPDGHTVRQGGVRLHGAMATDDVHANAKDFTWYPEGRPSMVALVGSSHGPLLYTPHGVSYNTTSYSLTGPEFTQIRRMVYYCADPTKCRWPNGSQMEAHFVILRVPLEWDNASYDEDRAKNGYFTFHGYTNRWGDLLTSRQCDNLPLGPDCIPTVYDHVPVADADTQHRDSSSDVPMFNYDIAPSGKYWVQFPN